jgi:hypothetical protein
LIGCPIFCKPIMPPKPGPSNEGQKKLKFGLFGNRRSDYTIPDPTTSRAPPGERPKNLKFGLQFGERRSKNTIPDSTSINIAAPSARGEELRKLKFGLFGDKISNNTIPNPTTNRARPSDSGEGSSRRAICNARLALDALRTASNMSEVLGPLKLVCFALKVVVDTAEVGSQLSSL